MLRRARSDAASALWQCLPFFCASIEDSPYLEQKVATLMAALEYLIRSSLVEAGQYSPKNAQKLDLDDLLGAARHKLGWKIPNHYTAKSRHRLLRNAVAHGGQLPSDANEVRHDFDKWHLFLLRRALMRLNYTGRVACPVNGWALMSSVDSFKEEHNNFGA